MGITKFGAYASHLNIDERYVVPLPSGWDFKEGAAFLVQAMTAYYALFTLGALKANDTVLIHSGAGGVGIYAHRLAKSVGARTIGTTGSAGKIDFMRKEGYDQVIVRSRSFSEDLKSALRGTDLNLIMECIGGKILRQGFDQLAPEGRMVVYGSAHFTSQTDRPNYLKLIYNYLLRPKIDPLQLPNTNRSLLGFNLIWLYDRVEKMHSMIQAMEALNLPKPHVGHTFSFAELPDAVRKLRSGNTQGKVVVLL
jgi:alcohol dehydrogenase